MGHGVHPNHVSKHEENHRPMLNQGLILKTNANIKYTSNAETRTLTKRLAAIANVNLQEFEVRNDMNCGSTIGPIVSKIGLRTVDIGGAQLSMHSIRETAGSEDVTSMIKFFETFYEKFADLDDEVGMLGE